MPSELEYLWTWFRELSGSRTGTGFGLNPLSYLEIEAWARLTQTEPSIWEVSVLRQMDSAALSVFAEKANKGSGKQAQEIDPNDWEALDRALGRLG